MDSEKIRNVCGGSNQRLGSGHGIEFTSLSPDAKQHLQGGLDKVDPLTVNAFERKSPT